jgi:hypothetical protein
MNGSGFPFVLPTTVTSLLLGIWLFLFLTGREQLKRIIRRTESLVLERVKVELRNNPSLTLEDFYRLFVPEWQRMILKSAWYVTHKTELFPIPARPGLVMKRMSLDENYIGGILVRNNIELKGYQFKKAKKEFSKQIRRNKDA